MAGKYCMMSHDVFCFMSWGGSPEHSTKQLTCIRQRHLVEVAKDTEIVGELKLHFSAAFGGEMRQALLTCHGVFVLEMQTLKNLDTANILILCLYRSTLCRHVHL